MEKGHSKPEFPAPCQQRSGLSKRRILAVHLPLLHNAHAQTAHLSIPLPHATAGEVENHTAHQAQTANATAAAAKANATAADAEGAIKDAEEHATNQTKDVPNADAAKSNATAAAAQATAHAQKQTNAAAAADAEKAAFHNARPRVGTGASRVLEQIMATEAPVSVALAHFPAASLLSAAQCTGGVSMVLHQANGRYNAMHFTSSAQMFIASL